MLGGPARTHASFSRVRPWLRRLRRLRAAARFLSQALLRAVPRYRSLRRRPPRLATWEMTRSILGRYFL